MAQDDKSSSMMSSMSSKFDSMRSSFSDMMEDVDRNDGVRVLVMLLLLALLGISLYVMIEEMKRTKELENYAPEDGASGKIQTCIEVMHGKKKSDDLMPFVYAEVALLGAVAVVVAVHRIFDNNIQECLSKKIMYAFCAFAATFLFAWGLLVCIDPAHSMRSIAMCVPQDSHALDSLDVYQVLLVSVSGFIVLACVLIGLKQKFMKSE